MPTAWVSLSATTRPLSAFHLTPEWAPGLLFHEQPRRAMPVGRVKCGATLAVCLARLAPARAAANLVAFASIRQLRRSADLPPVVWRALSLPAMRTRTVAQVLNSPKALLHSEIAARLGPRPDPRLRHLAANTVPPLRRLIPLLPSRRAWLHQHRGRTSTTTTTATCVTTPTALGVDRGQPR